MSQPASASSETFACVRCGAAVPVSAATCPACGLEVYPAESSSDGECRCAACGGDMAIDDRVCPHCGTEVTIPEPADDEFYCSECGGNVAADDRVCPHCVAELEDGEASSAALDQDEEYICSTCGGDVAADDKVCPHCGADVEEIDETPAAEPRVYTLTVREINFLKEAERLPETCAASVTPVDGEKLVIPALETKVGDIVIQFMLSEIVVSVGKHTEGRFPGARDAVDFIHEVVNDRIIFHFVDGVVDAYRAEELDDSTKIDWSYYVWSGPLRNQRTGIDWYRPDSAPSA